MTLLLRLRAFVVAVYPMTFTPKLRAFVVAAYTIGSLIFAMVVIVLFFLISGVAK